MKVTTDNRSQASVILTVCATLFIVAHCQNGLNDQGSHQDTSSDHSLDEVEEEPKHFSDQNEKYQGLHTSGSPKHGNMRSSEYKPQSETLVPQQPPPHHSDRQHDQINAEPPGTHTHSHFQDHQSHNEKQEKPGQASQNSHQFSNHHHQQPSSQQQQQQQEDPNQHLHDEQYSNQQRHIDQQRHMELHQREHHVEQHHQQHYREEQQHQTHQGQRRHQQHSEEQQHQTHQGQRRHQQHYNEEQQFHASQHHLSQQSHQQQQKHYDAHPQSPPTNLPQQHSDRSSQQDPSQSQPLQEQVPQSEQYSHQERQSSWPPGHSQQVEEEIQTEEVAPLQEPPHAKEMLNADNQAIVPPVLAEGEEEIGETSAESVAEDEIEQNAEPELTPQEKEAEELFQAGEKLINATYYKEYHEAYLNFLEAAKLNHQRAKEYIAFGYLFGDYLPQNVTKSAELFEELASKGSPRAQMGLAFMYGAGFFYNSSQAKALIYSTFGALGGDPLAQMALGYRYYAGIGVESTCETALTYYRKVATKVADGVTLAGGPVVQRILLQEEAESVGTNNSPMLDDDLLQYYHFLADKGDQQAQVVLGTLYYQGGKGVQINHEQAYHYFSTAAESGSGHALGYLGKMHSEGSPFITQNNQTAFEFFKKSSEKSNHIGQSGLGMMYLNGLGVDKDVSKAFQYFTKASDQGSVDGQLQLGIMYFSGNGVRTDYKLAVKYFTMASQKGHVLAYYNLAQMHATGTGVLRNCHTAVELFKNVAERGKWSEMMMDAHRMYHEGNTDTALVKYMFLADLGYEVAQSNVAYLLDSGGTIKFNVHESHQRALLQYSRAASQGSTLARLKMGDYYYYGLGTDVDYESAASHYRMASEQQSNAQAMFNLGYMHERGLGLKQDVHLAKRFYDMAAETSADAHVPVTMALLKLGLLYGVDVFSKEFEGISGVLSLLDPVAYLGPQWDLFLASALGGLLAVIYLMRRMR